MLLTKYLNYASIQIRTHKKSYTYTHQTLKNPYNTHTHIKNHTAYKHSHIKNLQHAHTTH